MGSAVNKLSDPFGIIPDGLQKMDRISQAPVLKAADALGLEKGGDGGGPFSMLKIIMGASAAAATAAPDPNLRPFNRPDRTPDLTETALADRRRSVSQALRRRKTASILTGETAAADALGTG